MGLPLRVLIIEDSEDDALLLLRELKRGGYDVAFERVDTAEALRESLTSKQWDIVTSDYSMPELTAPEALKIVQEKRSDLPFIIISGTVGEDIAVSAMKAGAHDFFGKGKLIRLTQAIERELREAQMRREREKAQTQVQRLLEQQVIINDLTLALGYLSDLEQIYHTIYARIGALMDVAYFILSFYDADEQLIRAGHIVYKGEIIDVANFPPMPLEPEGQGTQSLVIRTGQPMYVPDLSPALRDASVQNSVDPANNNLPAESTTEDSPQIRSALYIPMKIAGQTIGVLQIQSYKLDAYTIEDMDLLCGLANVAAIAIQNARLLDEVQLYANELELRVDQRTSQLQRVKDQVETILNNSSDAIILIRKDGTIERTNPASVALFGTTTGVFVGQSLFTFIEPAQVDFAKHELQRVVSSEQPERVEWMGRRRDGSLFAADVALAPVLDDHLQEVKVICNVRDVTVRRKAEQDLQNALQKEKEINELRSRIVSVVSHEFRNPLAAIQGFTTILKDRGAQLLEAKKGDLLEKILTQVRHLNGLIGDILAINRAEAVGLTFNPVATDLDSFCQGLVQEMQQVVQTCPIQFNGQSGVQTLIDPKLMRQAITNLLSNAIKYSPGGGAIKLDVVSHNHHSIIRVIDQGLGIPEDDLQQLFQVFHRGGNVGNIQGTGLGLVIVKQIVEVHQGTISVESRVGKGTTFTLTIPIVDAVTTGSGEQLSAEPVG